MAPYLTLMTPDAPQRQLGPLWGLREVFNALRWVVRIGAAWRYLPPGARWAFPPWHTVYQQTQRWNRAGCFAAIVNDLRVLIRLAEGREAQPTASIFDSRTLPSTPESGARAGYDGHKKRKGSKVHLAVDTLGAFLTLVKTPANASDRAQVQALAAQVQAVTGETVELSFVDQGYTGEPAEHTAAAHGIHWTAASRADQSGRGVRAQPRGPREQRAKATLGGAAAVLA